MNNLNAMTENLVKYLSIALRQGGDAQSIVAKQEKIVLVQRQVTDFDGKQFLV